MFNVFYLGPDISTSHRVIVQNRAEVKLNALNECSTVLHFVRYKYKIY